MKVSLIFMGLTFFFVTGLLAQSYYWEDPPKRAWFKSKTIDAGVGFINYYGDLTNKRQLSTLSLGYGASVSGHFSNRISASFQYQRGDFRGTRDFHSSAQGQETVRGKLNNFSGLAQFHFIPFHNFRRRTFRAVSYITKMNAYAFLGAGYILYTSSTSAANDGVAPRFASRGQISVPYGAGFRYRIDPRYSIGAEFGYVFLFTDEFDATSRAGTRGDTYSLFTMRFGYTFKRVRLRF